MRRAIHLDRLAQATEGYSGADIESVVKEAIEQAFVDGRSALDSDRLLQVIGNTYPLGEVMKKKSKEYAERIVEMKIKPAS
ncbi:hypothetical protein [Allochromatium tepidum]|uniref:AAA ATPase AAA+ lid domain-containing protein n=1 Tax=Allochromatium tepidum TaxID=553982 RepID=A0ABN6GCD0_9GAMM|nr:hypothetical protein [Allochromatium tepidum]BCU07596.1 hypothetical protein Atep_22730 [Allochromatium tepidum]